MPLVTGRQRALAPSWFWLLTTAGTFAWIVPQGMPHTLHLVTEDGPGQLPLAGAFQFAAAAQRPAHRR